MRRQLEAKQAEVAQAQQQATAAEKELEQERSRMLELARKQAGQRYGVHGIPTSVLIDKNGIVQSIAVGYVANEGDLQKRIEKLARE